MARGIATVTETEWKGFVRAFKAEMEASTSRTLDLLPRLVLRELLKRCGASLG